MLHPCKRSQKVQYFKYEYTSIILLHEYTYIHRMCVIRCGWANMCWDSVYSIYTLHIIKCRKCFELTGPDDCFPFCSSRATDDVAIRPSTNTNDCVSGVTSDFLTSLNCFSVYSYLYTKGLTWNVVVVINIISSMERVYSTFHSYNMIIIYTLYILRCSKV